MTSLTGHELVVHLFAVADGTATDRQRLLDLWAACCRGFALTGSVASLPSNAPTDLGPTSAPGGVLAAREIVGVDVHQAVLRRLRDVVVLSTVCAPGDGRAWPELEREWEAALTGATALPTLGSVRILQARTADAATPLDITTLAPVVAAASGTPGDWAGAGVVRAAAPLGPFAVWEVGDPPPDRTAWDHRADRRIVVVAGVDRDDELSSWTWTRGSAEMTPFAQYLLHAARIRYQLRVRTDGADPDPRIPADTAIATLLRLCDDIVRSGREPDARALLEASAPLVSLQAGQVGLTDRASRLRAMRRTVEIATRNLTAHGGAETPTGLFADDAELAGWAALQLDNDLTYLDAVLERARGVTALADQLVQRGAAARQERFTLGLTGVVGAILMVLAAIQALRLEFTLSRPLLGGVVTGLGALALLVPAVLLRIMVPGRRWPPLMVGLAGGLVACSVPWIVMTAVGADAPTVLAAAVTTGLVGGGVGWVASRRDG